MFGPGYPGTGIVEGGNHGEGWEIREAEMWALEKNKWKQIEDRGLILLH